MKSKYNWIVAVIYSSGDNSFIISWVSTITNRENKMAPPIAKTNWKALDWDTNAPIQPPTIKISKPQNKLKI